MTETKTKNPPIASEVEAGQREEDRREMERRRASRRAHRRVRIPAVSADMDRRAADRREGLG
ncbi:MAG: hypothetical protein ABI592_11180 [Acidobacteriota bacterium]